MKHLFALAVFFVVVASVRGQTDYEMSKRQQDTWKHVSAFHFKIGIRSHYRPGSTYFYVGMIDRLYQMISSDLMGYVRTQRIPTPLTGMSFVRAQHEVEWLSRLFTATTNQHFIQVDEKFILDLFPPPVPMERHVAKAWTMQFVQVSFLMMDQETGIAAQYRIHKETPTLSFASAVFRTVMSFTQKTLKDYQVRIIHYIAAAGRESNAYLQYVYAHQGMRLPKDRKPKFSRHFARR